LDIIDRIDMLVIEKGLTGTDLCRDLNLSVGVYSQWKARISKPSNKNVKRIADYFGVPVSHLVYGTPLQTKKSPPHDDDLDMTVDRLMEKLKSDDTLMFSGEVLTDEAAQYLQMAIEAAKDQVKKIQERGKK
jgi:transcriptional regulator with XRE-family HTH domain